MAAAVACTVVAIKDSLKMAAAVACTVVAIIGTVSKVFTDCFTVFTSNLF